jgi:hypothetical protein
MKLQSSSSRTMMMQGLMIRFPRANASTNVALPTAKRQFTTCRSLPCSSLSGPQIGRGGGAVLVMDVAIVAACKVVDLHHSLWRRFLLCLMELHTSPSIQCLRFTSYLMSDETPTRNRIRYGSGKRENLKKRA